MSKITTHTTTITTHTVELDEAERWVQTTRYGVREFTVDTVTVVVDADERGKSLTIRVSGIRKLKSGRRSVERMSERYYPGFGQEQMPKQIHPVLAELGLARGGETGG